MLGLACWSVLQLPFYWSGFNDKKAQIMRSLTIKPRG